MAKLGVAHEDMEVFLNGCLQELSSQKESQNLIRELSQRLSNHNNQIWKLVQDPELPEGEVSQ